MSTKAAKLSQLQQLAQEQTAIEQARFNDEATSQKLLYDKLIKKYNQTKDEISGGANAATTVLQELQAHWDKTDHTKPTGARLYQLLKNTVPGAHTAITAVKKGISAIQDIHAGKEAAIQKHLVKPLLDKLPNSPGYNLSKDILPHLVNPTKLINDPATQRRVFSKLAGPLLDKIDPKTKGSIQKVLESETPAQTARDEIYKHAITKLTGHSIPTDVNFDSQLWEKGHTLDADTVTHLLSTGGVSGTNVDLAQKLIRGEINPDHLTQIATQQLQKQYPNLDPEDIQIMAHEALRRAQNPAEDLNAQSEALKDRLASINHPLAQTLLNNPDPKAAIADILTANTKGHENTLLKMALGSQDPDVQRQAVTQVKALIGKTALRSAGLPPELYDKLNAAQLDKQIQSARGVLNDLQTNPEATKQKLVNGAVALAKTNYETTQPHLYNAVRNVANKNFSDAAENVIDHVISKQSPELQKVASVAKPVIRGIYKGLQGDVSPPPSFKDKIKSVFKSASASSKQLLTDFTNEAGSDLLSNINKRAGTIPSHLGQPFTLADLATTAAHDTAMQSAYNDLAFAADNRTTAHIGATALSAMHTEPPGSLMQEGSAAIRDAAGLRLGINNNVPGADHPTPIIRPGTVTPKDFAARAPAELDRYDDYYGVGNAANPEPQYAPLDAAKIKKGGTTHTYSSSEDSRSILAPQSSTSTLSSSLLFGSVKERAKAALKGQFGLREPSPPARELVTAPIHSVPTEKDITQSKRVADLINKSVNSSFTIPPQERSNVLSMAYAVDDVHAHDADLRGQNSSKAAVEATALHNVEPDNPPPTHKDIESLVSRQVAIQNTIKPFSFGSDDDEALTLKAPTYSRSELYRGHIIQNKVNPPSAAPSPEAASATTINQAFLRTTLDPDEPDLVPLRTPAADIARGMIGKRFVPAPSAPSKIVSSFPRNIKESVPTRAESHPLDEAPTPSAPPETPAAVNLDEGEGEEDADFAHFENPSDTVQAQFKAQLADTVDEGEHTDNIVPTPPPGPPPDYSGLITNEIFTAAPGIVSLKDYIQNKIKDMAAKAKAAQEKSAQADKDAKAKAAKDKSAQEDKENEDLTPENDEPATPSIPRRRIEAVNEEDDEDFDPTVRPAVFEGVPAFATPQPPPEDAADDANAGNLEDDEEPYGFDPNADVDEPYGFDAANYEDPGTNAPAAPKNNGPAADADDDIHASPPSPNATVNPEPGPDATPATSAAPSRKTEEADADEDDDGDGGDALGDTTDAIGGALEKEAPILSDAGELGQGVTELADPFTAILGLGQIAAGGYQLYEGLKGGPPAPPPPTEALLQAPLPISAGDPVVEQNNASNTFLGESADNI